MFMIVAIILNIWSNQAGGPPPVVGVMTVCMLFFWLGMPLVAGQSFEVMGDSPELGCSICVAYLCCISSFRFGHPRQDATC